MSELTEKQKEGRRRIEQVLEELVDLIGPTSFDPDDLEGDTPEGPWVVNGWALQIDFSTLNSDEDRETWTACMRSTGLPRAYALGLAFSAVDEWA